MAERVKIDTGRGVGYSTDTRENHDYVEDGLLCPWEHCVELYEHSNDPLRCSVFGHKCPGGDECSSNCDRTIEDFPESRLVTP